MIGRQISHYQVVDTIGAGGMGVVYAAKDLRLGRDVALKFLPDKLAADPDALERFRREARAASALSHPNICTIYDIGEHEGQPFIAMELLRGVNLATRIAARPMKSDEFIDVALQIAAALEAAHSAQIVHRDIKSGNIFLTERGQAKILDFGLAKLADLAPENPQFDVTHQRVTTDRQLTEPGTTMGTVAYMSPEQLLGEPVDRRTDIFSFGVVLYEMATGARPFAGGTTAAMSDAILRTEPAPVSGKRPDLPAAIDAIVAKAIEKDRQIRYQTAADLRADLLRASRDQSGKAASTPTSAVPVRFARGLQVVHPWDAVARDGRALAEQGSGIMYWFRVPLGGVCYPDGFLQFLQPALENPAISKVRFVLDGTAAIRQTWEEMVIPLVQRWAEKAGRVFPVERQPDSGQFIEASTGRSLAWIFVDLSQEFTPCFKVMTDDPASGQRSDQHAFQVFLSTATRTVRLSDGGFRTIRIPDTVLRGRAPDDENLTVTLSRVASQWDLMFP